MYIVNLNVLTLFVTIHFERIIVHSWKPHNHNYNVPRTNKKFSAVIFQTTHSSNLLTKHNQLHFLRWGKIISRTNEYVLFNLSSILITSYKKKRTVFWIFYGRRHDTCLECLMYFVVGKFLFQIDLKSSSSQFVHIIFLKLNACEFYS